MDRTYVERNRMQRERLERVCLALGSEQLGRPLAGGWTVAAALAHLAFWDRRTLAALDELERREAPVSWPPGSAEWDAVNAGELEQWLATPPAQAAAEALAAARTVDRTIEAFPDDLAETLAGAGRGRMLDRSIHRAEHLDQIEQALTV